MFKQVFLRPLYVLIVVLLSKPVFSAELHVGDVLYCTSDYFYGTDMDKINNVVRYKPDNFKLFISNNSVSIATSEYFENTPKLIKSLNKTDLVAQDEYSTFRLLSLFNSDDVIFSYASANPFALVLMKGICNKF